MFACRGDKKVRTPDETTEFSFGTLLNPQKSGLAVLDELHWASTSKERHSLGVNRICSYENSEKTESLHQAPCSYAGHESTGDLLGLRFIQRRHQNGAAVELLCGQVNGRPDRRTDCGTLYAPFFIR